jgi:hypothetical protein
VSACRRVGVSARESCVGAVVELSSTGLRQNGGDRAPLSRTSRLLNNGDDGRVSSRFIDWVSDGLLKLTFPDGKTTEDAHRAGETEWLTAQKHSGENLGDKPIDLIAVIPKR